MGILERFWYRKAQGEIKTFYHGTSATNARKIEKDGVLKPRAALQHPIESAEDYLEYGYNQGNFNLDPSREDCVYVTPDRSLALSYARYTSYNDEAALIVVEADMDALILDEDEVGERLLKGKYPEIASRFIDTYPEDLSHLDENYFEGEDQNAAMRVIYNDSMDAWNAAPFEFGSTFSEHLKDITGFIEQNRPDIKAEILSESNTFCLQEEVPILQVIYL